MIDTFARRIVGWRVSRSAATGFVLDALEQALYERRPFPRGGLVHHSDRGGPGRIKRSSQHLDEGVAMGTRKRRSDQAERGVLRSPGRPGVARREDRRRFWAAIAAGVGRGDAAGHAGGSPAGGGPGVWGGGGGPPPAAAAPAHAPP